MLTNYTYYVSIYSNNTKGVKVMANKKTAKKNAKKKSGFDAPAYGRMLKPDEKFEKMPNGLLKIVKK